MNFDEKKTKLEYLQHFLEGGGFPVRINPIFANKHGRLSEEEETLVVMYINEKMPYLETYHSNSWKETMVRLKTRIPVEDELYYYKNELKQTEDYFYDIFGKIQKLVE